MKTLRVLFALLIIICSIQMADVSYGQQKKNRIFVISSYHKELIWTQSTNEGVCAAFLQFKFLDNREQAQKYTKNDYVESSKAIIKKAWMDTKRKSNKSEIGDAVSRIVKEIDKFKPDLILLGDDNATNYIGNQYVDGEIPVVFWGVNGLPLKYGLLDSVERPGHNVTGIYQESYLKETVEYLKKIVPTIKTIAVLSDDSPTGRAYTKKFKRLAETGELPAELVGIVVTNSFSEWKQRAFELQKKTDAFFLSMHHTIKDKNHKSVDPLKAIAWYLRNIKKFDCGPTRDIVEEGILLTVEDSAFNQGYEAAKMAYQILEKGKNPAEMASYFPAPGPFIVNRERAKMLGIEYSIEENKKLIDVYIDSALALEKYPE